MKFIGLLMAFAVGACAYAQSFENSIVAVEKDSTKSDILVYKVKNQTMEFHAQNFQPFLARQSFKTHSLFQGTARILGAETGRYFVRKYPAPLSKEEAIAELRALQSDRNVELAYFEPRVTDAVMLDRMQKPLAQQGEDPPPAPQASPLDFESKQFYLEAAPEGVDARYAWTVPGGTGKGIRVIDVETGWDTNHFEFGVPFYENGSNARVDHGTAVWGQIAARRDGQGVTGIAYDVEYGIAGNGWGKPGFNDYPNNIASVIADAVASMQPGDVIVIEQHAPLVGEFGPIEYFEPVFKILKSATDAGIHCVAAAGNGYANLDDAKYNGAFDLNVRDSGCVLVGAALSPQRTNKHQRADFSDYGSRVDAFGYGEDVVTTGYGDLFSGQYQGKTVDYTESFSGTSSATPIVSGAVISVLGIAKAQGVTISPKDLRAALRATGTPQSGSKAAEERIGNLPDIKQLLGYLRL